MNKKISMKVIVTSLIWPGKDNRKKEVQSVEIQNKHKYTQIGFIQAFLDKNKHTHEIAWL